MDIVDKEKGWGHIKLEKFRVGEDTPYEVREAHNIWLTTGWTNILSVIIGASTAHWDSTNARIGVGDDYTIAAASQTDLIASTNKTYGTMTSGYPTTPSSGTVQFKTSFGTSEANYVHNELVVKNNSSSVCWNRSSTGYIQETFTGSIGAWTGANWAYNSNNVIHTAGSTAALTEATKVAVSGHTYEVTFTVSGRSAGDVTMAFGGAGTTARSTNNTFVENVTAVNTNAITFTPSNDFDGVIDTITVKDVLWGTKTSAETWYYTVTLGKA